MTVQPTRDQLRALANAATPGPWVVKTCEPCAEHGREDIQIWDERGHIPITQWMDEVDPDAGDDAAFIAAARNALPQLLDQLDAAEQRIRDLTQEVKDERGAALDQMEQVTARDKRIGRLENRAATETARADEWRRRHHVMAGKRDAAHRAYQAERGVRRVAETRLKAVRDVLDAEEARPRAIGGGYDKRTTVRIADIRRALDN